MTLAELKTIDGMRIHSISDLDNIIPNIQFRIFEGYMENYRGHGLRDYKLIPGLCRNDIEFKKLREIEKELYTNFINGVDKKEFDAVRVPFTIEPYGDIRNYWYLLFQAQHLGLKTRLMDWTISWQTALLFAVEDEKHHGKDGSFWIYLCQDANLLNHGAGHAMEKIYPLDFDQNYMINSPIYLFDDVIDIVGEKRMGNQHGRFWIQSLEKSQTPLNEQQAYSPYLAEIIIDGNSKSKIKKELMEIGFNINQLYYRDDEKIDKAINQINGLLAV
jgi:hypothetical protein